MEILYVSLEMKEDLVHTVCSKLKILDSVESLLTLLKLIVHFV